MDANLSQVVEGAQSLDASAILTLVTSGGFGALLWYFVVKHVPAIEARHKAERDEAREFMADQMELWRAAVKELHDAHHERDKQVDAITEKYHNALKEQTQVLTAISATLDRVEQRLERDEHRAPE